MRKLSIIIGIAALLGTAACQWGKPGNRTHAAITHDTLKYKYLVYSKNAPDCGKRKDSSCTNVKINYPDFEQFELNDEVRERVIDLFKLSDSVKARNFEDVGEQFISLYNGDSSNYKAAYLLHINARVIRQDSSLISLQVSGEEYAGGAHGSSAITFLNWNTKNKHVIGLKDLLVDNYQQRLNAVAEAMFRKQEHLADTASLKDYFFKNDKFRLNNNFLITPIGLRFLYNEYEIKPYAAGATDLLIPYMQIKELIRPGTVIAQYHP